MTATETEKFEYRGLSVCLFRTDDPMEPPADDPGAEGPFSVGDFYVGIAEWGLASGASLPDAATARRFAERAVDAVFDRAVPPREAMATGGSGPLGVDAWPELARMFRYEVATADGDCGVFYNAVAHDSDEDPYLDKIGWHYQSGKYDDGPRGPFASATEASEAALDHYGWPPAEAPRV